MEPGSTTPESRAPGLATASRDRARSAPLTPWPAALLVAAVTLLVAIPLWTQDYAYAPLHEGLRWALRFAKWIGAACAIRLAVAAIRQRSLALPPLRWWLRQAASIVACACIFGVLTSTYTWGKLFLPLFSPPDWDAPLWAFDRALHFDVDLNRLLLGLFRPSPRFELLIDWSYQQFYFLLLISVSWFLSTSTLDDRHRVLRGQVLLWLGGLAGYWLLPALGPVYMLQDLYSEVASHYPRNAHAQRIVLANYNLILEILAGKQHAVRLGFGIAAMPSLHVAMPTYFLLHCIERKNPLRLLYLVIIIFTILGALATGWHYAVDLYAGMLLALACWWAVRLPRPVATRPAKLPAPVPASDGAPGN